MIVIDPINLISNQKEVADFYIQLLGSLNIPTMRVNVMPFSVQGEITCTNVDANIYFDIGNRNFGNILGANIAAYKGKTLYHGSLKVTNYFSAVAGGEAQSSELITTGKVSSLDSWFYQGRIKVVAPDDSGAGMGVNSPPQSPAGGAGSNPTAQGAPHTFQFDNILFSFIRKVVSAVGTATQKCEYIFVGVRIDYQ